MPTYTFRDRTTGESKEHFMTISAREVFMQENPNLEQVITGAPLIVDPIRIGVKKTSSPLNEKLNSVKRYYKNSNIDTR